MHDERVHAANALENPISMISLPPQFGAGNQVNVIASEKKKKFLNAINFRKFSLKLKEPYFKNYVFL